MKPNLIFLFTFVAVYNFLSNFFFYVIKLYLLCLIKLRLPRYFDNVDIYIVYILFDVQCFLISVEAYTITCLKLNDETCTCHNDCCSNYCSISFDKILAQKRTGVCKLLSNPENNIQYDGYGTYQKKKKK